MLMLSLLLYIERLQGRMVESWQVRKWRGELIDRLRRFLPAQIVIFTAVIDDGFSDSSATSAAHRPRLTLPDQLVARPRTQGQTTMKTRIS